jgi:hypothetical protein
MHLLQYRAGTSALAALRRHGGLALEEVEALVLPAIGPKWLVLSGFDRALMRAGWLAPQASRRLLLFGASAGAWRGFALAASEPLLAHDRLLASYCAQRFTRTDNAAAISDAYRQVLGGAFTDADRAAAVAHPRLDLAVATVRARGLLGKFEQRNAQAALLGLAGFLNALAARSQALFYERVVFATTGAATHPLLNGGHGTVAPLRADNVLDVALASGTVPMYMQSVRGIEGAPAGAYLDGGFSDYHLNRPAAGSGITILFLHQRRIVPSWLDKFLPWRTLDRRALDRLLLVYPDPEFVRGLPGGAVPTREDFHRFEHEPEQRIERWKKAAAQSGELGDAFIRDWGDGTLASRVREF